MKGWRAPVVLLLVVILLALILGIKILNNTPEKQLAELKNNSNKTEYEEFENIDIENMNAEEYLKEIQKIAQKRALKQSAGKLMIMALIGGFFVFCIVKIYSKLGIEGLPVTLWVLSVIVSFLVIFIFNERLSDIISAISGILSIILLIMQYKVIGVNPWLLLSVIIPVVGVFAVLIVAIYGQCKLGAYFGKGTGFQLGLIFLPFIFMPILAFSDDV